MIFTDADIGQNIASALSSMSLWTAVAKSVLIILVGFIFTKTKIFPENTGKVLTKVVMTVCLPCLAFGSFMTNITTDDFESCITSFVYGFGIYIVLIFLSKLIFLWVKDPTKRKVMEILFIFGSTTFFGQPLIQAVFPTAYNDSSMFNIAYRVFLYSYAFYVICYAKDANQEVAAEATDGLATQQAPAKQKMDVKVILKRIFVNPIIIATFVGFILWSLQLIDSKAESGNWWIVTVNGTSGCFWNIKVSLPWLYNTINTLGGLSSPLVWIAIGCTLGKVSFKDAVKDKDVWIFSFLRVIALPALNFGILFLLNLIPNLNITFNLVAATTLMWAVPPATVAITYCISSNKHATFASSCSLLGTLISVCFIPVYMILLTVIQSAQIFA